MDVWIIELPGTARSTYIRFEGDFSRRAPSCFLTDTEAQEAFTDTGLPEQPIIRKVTQQVYKQLEGRVQIKNCPEPCLTLRRRLLL